MIEGQASRTAYGAAVERALHQEEPPDRRIFDDPLAWRILGGREAAWDDAQQWAGHPMQTFLAVRHRFAEDCLAAAVERGTRQAVVLGAGLDTSAHRAPWPGVTFWEVDHPDTQAWKRGLVADAGLDDRRVRYVPVDFEHDDLLDRLRAGGFDDRSPATFLWLGVVPYLTREAVEATLSAVASVSGGEVVFEHTTPLAGLTGTATERRTELGARVAEVGEPLTAGWEREEMAALLVSLGFDDVEVLGRAEIRTRYLGKSAGAPRPDGALLVRARR